MAEYIIYEDANYTANYYIVNKECEEAFLKDSNEDGCYMVKAKSRPEGNPVFVEPDENFFRYIHIYHGFKQSWDMGSEGTIEAIAEIDGKKYRWYFEWGMGPDDYIDTWIDGVKQETAYMVFYKWSNPNGDFFMNIVDYLEEVEDIAEMEE